MQGFGTYIRSQREALAETSKNFSVRKVAKAIDVEPAFLSKVEREVVAPPVRSQSNSFGGSTWRGSGCTARHGRQGIL